MKNSNVCIRHLERIRNGMSVLNDLLSVQELGEGLTQPSVIFYKLHTERNEYTSIGTYSGVNTLFTTIELNVYERPKTVVRRVRADTGGNRTCTYIGIVWETIHVRSRNAFLVMYYNILPAHKVLSNKSR